MSIFVAIDLETTGLSPYDDAIIEFACIKFNAKNFQEIDVLSGFVNPWIAIPPLVQELTGISDADLDWTPSISSVLQDIEWFIWWFPLVGHNIDFDISFLKSAGLNLEKNPTIDTFYLANSLCFHHTSLSLTSLCEYFSIELTSAHRALDDTRATYKLLDRLSKNLAQSAQLYPDIYYHLYKNAEKQGDQILYQTYIRPVLWWQIYIEENIKQTHISRLHALQESDIKSSTGMTDTHVSSFDILQTLPKFEYRESQKMMCDIVDSLFTWTSKIALEAPTGTGKTFVYLIASLIHARKTWSQICIATSTKLLQDQICEEDLSYLKSYLPFEFTYAKLTGKKNYFSLWAYHSHLALYKTFSRSQLSFFLKLYLWSLESFYWELRELEFYNDEYSFLPYIDASYLSYQSSDNIYWEFYLFARKKAEFSDLIITNSYVLMQECIQPSWIFQNIENLVIDEAHSLEDIITSSALQKFSQTYLEQLFSLFDRKIQKYRLNLDLTNLQSTLEFSIVEMLQECEKIIKPHFPSTSRYKKYLFRDLDIKSNSFLLLCAKNTLEKLLDYENILSSTDWKKYFSYELQILEDMKHFIFLFFIDPKFSEYIYIWEIEEKGKISLSLTVRDTWAFLQTKLWAQKTRILLTSATLFVPQRQLYSDKILGIVDFVHYTLPPVFDYRKQSYVYIPTNLKNSYHLWQDTLKFLETFFTQVRWRTLMLCTSYSAIKELYLALHSTLLSQWIRFIAQWLAWGKNKHLETFLAYPATSVLVGTDSFWQGVDIPGDNLQYLVIHKLPFTPPSDPIFLARSSLFQDPFYDYAISKTGIKLRQWLWRLIRSHSDTGVILFLDDRILHQKWGKYFLEVFPEDISIFRWTSENFLTLLSKE